MTNVFEIEKTADPNTNQENNTSQFAEEKPFQPITTVEEYIALCDNDLPNALEQLAYIRPGKLYNDCIAHIHEIRQQHYLPFVFRKRLYCLRK